MEIFIIFYLLLISILHLNNIFRDYQQHSSRQQSGEKTVICNASLSVTVNSFILILSSKSTQTTPRSLKYPLGLKPLRGKQQNKWFEASKNINLKPFPALHNHHIHLLLTIFALREVRLTKTDFHFYVRSSDSDFLAQSYFHKYLNI